MTSLVLAFLVLSTISDAVYASEIIVSPGNSIQNSINIAASGDTIIVKPGTYKENLKITKDNLTIRSESGIPDDTVIEAKYQDASVFLLQADNVKIKGFNITGSTRFGNAGVCLSYCSNCTVEDNKLLSNSFGIYLSRSTNNTVLRNTISDGSRGIYILRSEGNRFSGNTVTGLREYGIALQNATSNVLSGSLAVNNERGIYLGSSDGNTLTRSTVRNNKIFGFYICGASDRNTIYDNYFNDTNMTIQNGIGNTYNITKTAGTNIVGGPYIGGNYWGKPDGSGFSQKAVDKNWDGISDSVYTRITGSKYSDFLPLIIMPKTEANFWGSPRSGALPLDVSFTDISTGSPTAWNWDFGDGTFSNQQNPVHTYSEAGNFTVTLTASNVVGNDTRSKNNYIIVLEKPVADFWGSQKSGEVPLSVTFTDISTGSPTAWNWDFGDGNYSSDQNPVHTFSEPGNYSITLTVSNAVGNNTRAKNNYITVLEKPAANFWGSPRSGAVPLDVSFTDISTGSPTAWNWSLGDGTFSNQQNPAHTYSEAGNYTVTLTASNAVGNDTKIKYNYITVLEKPAADFWCTPESGEAPLSVAFNDKSTGSPTAWNWDFGDGTSSNEENPVHTYSDAGNYTVTLTDSNAAGSDSRVKTSYITVLEKPVADFWGSPKSGIAPLNVTFTDNSTGTSNELNWSFGDGIYSTVKDPIHTYSTAGIYTVKLTASNAVGTSTKIKNNYINVSEPEKISVIKSKMFNNRLREASPESILPNSSFLDVGGLKGVGRYRDALWFNLSEYNSAVQINNATLSLFWYYPSSLRLNDTVIEIYRPASAWNSTYVSWNKKDKNIAWVNPGGDWYDKNGILQGSTPYAKLTLKASSLPGNSYCEFDVTDLVREYASGKYSNTGFLIKARSESDNYVAFYSAQCGNASEVPELKLVYS